MRISMQRLAARFGVLFAGVGLSIIFGAASASAATVTWNGADGGDLSTASNWSPTGVPTVADDVVFDITGLANTQVLTNTAPISVKTITMSGTNASNLGYALDGSAISVLAGITNSTTLSALEFDAPLTLTGSQTFTTTNYISFTALDLNGFNLSVGGSLYSTGRVGSAISGSGNIIVTTGADIFLPDASPAWTGALSIASNATAGAKDGGALGSASNSVTVTSGGQIKFCAPTGATVNQSITIGGSGQSNYGALAAYASCGGPLLNPTDTGNITLAGSITLTGDTTVGATDTVTITGALSGAHTITVAPGSAGSLVISSSNNQSSTPNGSANAPVTSTTYAANSPSTDISLGTNQTGIVTGTYRNVDIIGGTLKGTGTIGTLSMMSGTVAPGMSPGVLNAGNTSFNGGTFQAELGGTAAGEFDQLNVTGTVDLGVDVTVLDTVLYGTFTPAAGDSFMIIKNDLADATNGTFKGLAEGATFTVSGYVFKISYVGGDGNDVVLTVQSVPALPKTGFSLPLANAYLVLIAAISMAGVLGFAAWKLNATNNHLS